MKKLKVDAVVLIDSQTHQNNLDSKKKYYVKKKYYFIYVGHVYKNKYLENNLLI